MLQQPVHTVLVISPKAYRRKIRNYYNVYIRWQYKNPKGVIYVDADSFCAR